MGPNPTKPRRLISSRKWVGLALIAFPLATAAVWLNHRTHQYDEIIARTASRYDVDFDLVKAIIYEESWFRPDIRGAAGELGLMQVTKRAAADFCTRNGFPAIQDEGRILEPRMNIEIGCWYLKQSLERYQNSPAPVLFALLRYNAGETRSDGWLRLATSEPVPAAKDADSYYLDFVSYPTTRNYVRRILKRSRNRNYWF